MFIAKPVLFILFFIAIGSTAGLLFVLSQRSALSSPSPSATTTVVVSPRVSSSPTAENSSSPSAEAITSSAEWKSYTTNGLSLKLEYPANWKLDATDAAVLRIQSSDSSTGSGVLVSISREKKASSATRLTAFAKQREDEYKKNGFDSFKDEKTYAIAGYDGTERYYVQGDKQIREIVFATKNYFYFVTTDPGQTDQKAVIDELLKTITIL